MEPASRHSLLLFPFFLTLCCAVRTLEAAGGCSWKVKWVDYGGGPKDIACKDSRRTWWARNTAAHGELTDCATLQADEWTLSTDGCTESCPVHADRETSSLEYCCTSGPGANPADVPANQRDCYYIAVCPLIMSATIVPSGGQLLAGHRASLYLSLISRPLPTSQPRFHNQIGPSLSSIPVRSDNYTNYLNATAAYTFTVPAEGKVYMNLNGISAPDGAGCGPLRSSGVVAEYYLPIIGDSVAEPDPSPQCDCSPPLPTHSAEQSSAGHVSLTPSPSSSPSFSSSPSPSISSTPLPTTTKSISALSDTDCDEKRTGVVVWLGMGLGISLMFLVCAVVFAAWATVRVCRLKRKLRQFVAPVSKEGGLNAEVKPPLPIGFSSPPLSHTATPSSPPPPLPSSSPPPSRSSSFPPPPNEHTHHNSSESSVDSGKAPSDTELYSIPFQNETSPRSTRCTSPDTSAKRPLSLHTVAAAVSPGHVSTASSSVVDLQTVDHMTSVHCVCYQHEGTEKYAFINGQMYRREDEEVNLDESLNIGSPRVI